MEEKQVSRDLCISGYAVQTYLVNMISKAKFTGTVHNENFRKHAKKRRPTLGKSTAL